MAGAKLVKQKKKSKRKAKGASVKLDLWQRTGYVPDKPSAKKVHKKYYETKMNLPEGKGTGRSLGSNKRLRKFIEN